jgi:hypothetical protein
MEPHINFAVEVGCALQLANTHEIFLQFIAATLALFYINKINLIQSSEEVSTVSVILTEERLDLAYSALKSGLSSFSAMAKALILNKTGGIDLFSSLRRRTLVAFSRKINSALVGPDRLNNTWGN